MQEELGIDVLVSHKIGETPVSYQEGSHSGGQGTKIAIMLLLAAMSLGQAADLLIVDEHNAHLDGTNTGQIAQLMRRLSSRVQFILRACREITRSFPECGMLMCYGRQRGTSRSSGGEVRGGLPASG
jgi:ABC-type Mn2+/Zn2+ transport system ATPase subunit